LNSIRRLEVAENNTRLLQKTLVNEFISLKLKILREDEDKEVYKNILNTEKGIIEMIPESKFYIEKLEFWQPSFEDFDTPIDFSEHETQKNKK
jgi:uncharacterized membrane protein YheB (UPF0754 family)